jgi:YfiH family protein
MRYGGVSEGLFSSLNGKKGSGDSDSNVNENRKRALAGLCHPELDPRSNCLKHSCLRKNGNMAHITHEFKSNILQAGEMGEYQGCDASVTSEKGLVLSQATADCGTVIIADIKGCVVSLIHGSWHTLRDEIIYKTVEKIREHTSNELVAGIGPMICQGCYEFGAEASEVFDQKYLRKSKNKYFVDLKAMIFDQLHAAGVQSVDDLGVCTLEDGRFFSHRKDGAASGRFISAVSL